MARGGASGGLARVLLADSTRMGNQLLLEALRRDTRFNIVGLVTVPEELTALVPELNPDVAVIGANANGSARRGFDLLRHTLARYPRVRSVMLLDSSTRNLVVHAFRAGARGVICRDEGLGVLLKCVYAVHLGQVWANNAQLSFVLEDLSHRWLPQAIVDESGLALLSKRELDVVRCVSQGMINRDIASHLKLSQHTVKNYLFRTFDKLGVSNRAELILYAINYHGCTHESTFTPHDTSKATDVCRLDVRLPAAESKKPSCDHVNNVHLGSRTVRRPGIAS